MSRFIPDPDCVYCEGSGRMHHRQPPGLSDERWFEFQGLGHCPACASWPRKGLVRFQDKTVALVLFVAVGRRTLATCPEAGCDHWHDVTAFVPPPEVTPQNTVLSSCQRGHSMQLSVVEE